MTAVVALTMAAVLFMSTVSRAACILTKYTTYHCHVTRHIISLVWLDPT